MDSLSPPICGFQGPLMTALLAELIFLVHSDLFVAICRRYKRKILRYPLNCLATRQDKIFRLIIFVYLIWFWCTHIKAIILRQKSHVSCFCPSCKRELHQFICMCFCSLNDFFLSAFNFVFINQNSFLIYF